MPNGMMQHNVSYSQRGKGAYLYCERVRAVQGGREEVGRRHVLEVRQGGPEAVPVEGAPPSRTAWVQAGSTSETNVRRAAYGWWVARRQVAASDYWQGRGLPSLGKVAEGHVGGTCHTHPVSTYASLPFQA